MSKLLRKHLEDREIKKGSGQVSAFIAVSLAYLPRLLLCVFYSLTCSLRQILDHYIMNRFYEAYCLQVWSLALYRVLLAYYAIRLSVGEWRVYCSMPLPRCSPQGRSSPITMTVVCTQAWTTLF